MMNFRFSMPDLRFAFVLAVSAALGGCQATTEFAGNGPLRLSVQQAVQLEEYFNDPASAAIAVAAETGAFGTVKCPSGDCTYPEGSAEKQAVRICKTLNARCAVLAVGRAIVWNGAIGLPAATGENLPAQFSFKTSASVQTAAGVARLHEDRQSGVMSFGTPPNDCSGAFSAATGKWSMSCGHQFRIEGRLSAIGESQFRGLSYSEDMELKISRGYWPKLAAAVAAHIPSR